jgi:hypothetical protein
MEDKYMSLITDYMDGVLSPERKVEFDRYVKEGHINRQEIDELMAFEKKMATDDAPMPTAKLDDKFYSMLANEKAKAPAKVISFSARVAQILDSVSGKWAVAASILILGVVLGKAFSGSTYQKQMDVLSGQMNEMQEMIALSMLEENSVSKRLQGVQMSSELVSTHAEVADALLITLNNDESANVRLAALRMLAEYSDDAEIREGLINSIKHQESPVVLMAMAELMVNLQEKKALPEFNNILEGDNAPDELKSSLRENLDMIM